MSERRTRVVASLAGLVLLVAGCGHRAGSGPTVAALAPTAAPAPLPPSPGTTAAAARGLAGFTDQVARSGPAVVNISVLQKGRGALIDDDAPDDPLHDFLRRFGSQPHVPQPPARGEGSGFIISADGYILTNAHVVADATELTVRMTDRREFTAKVIGVDERTDIALLKIDGQGLPTVRFGDASKLRPGEWVIAIGSPFGFENSVTAGIVSATARSLPDGQYTPFIQTDAAVNPGNSGGPLFNMAGEVVGINSQIYSRTGAFNGIAFAIPIDIAIGVKDELIRTGRVQRGRIGVAIQGVGQQLADSFGLDRPRGALVAQVEAGAPAAKAGVRPGDVILGVNGKSIERSEEVSAEISRLKPGTHAELELWRDRAIRKVSVEVAELKESRSNRADHSDDRGGRRLGLTVRPLTPAERRADGLEGGLFVEDVAGPALKAGLQPGDIIVGANGVKLTGADELEHLIREAKGPVALLVNRGGTTLFVPVRPGG
jgi:serine protease Do